MTSTPGGTQAVDRAAALVATVVQADEPLSFMDLQEESGLPKSTTSRLLSALERTDLLERTTDGGYVAGAMFWLYAARHDPWEEVVRLARPIMERIGDETRESVHLSVARGGHVVQVAQVEATYMLGTADWTDVEVPAHCSALGKVLLAWDALEVTPDLDTPTEHTLVGRALARDLEQTRKRGYATSIDELEEGLCGVAAPVRGSNGLVFASLGVSAPTVRLEGRLDEVGAHLVDQADRVSRLFRRTSRKEGVA